MKSLGIDYGAKRVGISLSDDTATLAFPHDVFKNDERLVERIYMLYKQEHIKQIVLGDSKNFKGEPNAIMVELKAFKDTLEERVSIPVVLQDEFLTTAAARQAGSSEETVDAHAAALILQRYLDTQ